VVRTAAARALAEERESLALWLPTFTHTGVPYPPLSVTVRVSHTSTIASSKSTGTHELSNDTQASFGITNCLDLFGGIPLRTDVSFLVTDWAGDEREIHHHGMTVFGPMLYSETCSGTILCADDVHRFWRCDYGRDELCMTATHRTVRDLKLEFARTPEGKVLSCSVPDQLWDRVCALAHDVPPMAFGDSSELLSAEIQQALSRDDYRRVMEAIRFH
jgi:hypothetical protein